MAPVLRDMVLIVECVFLEFTGQCQESVQAHKQSGALSLSLTTKACVHPHICSNSCLTKVKDNLQTYFLKKKAVGQV